MKTESCRKCVIAPRRGSFIKKINNIYLCECTWFSNGLDFGKTSKPLPL